MGGDLLVWLVFFGFIFWMLQKRRRQQLKSGAPERQMFGYHRLPLERLNLTSPLLRLEGDGSWEVLSFEDFPYAKRRRLMLSIGYQPSGLGVEALEPLLWRLASAVQRALQAHVIVVEAFASDRPSKRLAGTGQWKLIYAVDGQGWSGSERLLAALEGEPLTTPRLYDLAEVQRRALETLDVDPLGE